MTGIVGGCSVVADGGTACSYATAWLAGTAVPPGRLAVGTGAWSLARTAPGFSKPLTS